MSHRRRVGNFRSVAKLEAAAARHDREQKQRNFASHFLHARLLAVGITQSELARRATKLLPNGMRVTRSSISKYLAGDSPNSKPNPIRLKAIADALGVRPEHIVPPAKQVDKFIPVDFRTTSDGKAWLRIDRAFSKPTALKILQLVEEEDAVHPYTNGHG